MKVQSVHLTHDTFRRYLFALGDMWALMDCPNIHKSITEILHVMVYRVEKSSCPALWFKGYAWYASYLTPEFTSSEVFRDFYLWADKLAAEVNHAEDWYIQLFWTSLRKRIIDTPDGHHNIFLGPSQEAANTIHPAVTGLGMRYLTKYLTLEISEGH
ncbi:hypothetical protein C8J56DRAFT_165333 [Mycena floridula]|nr:hypothetical protein C8J56DRAFT_165333 [Mycena floridula]